MDEQPCSFDYCYPASGQSFPDLMKYSGVVVFGGAFSANDETEHAWVRAEYDFIEQTLKHSIPFLGICLGAQMLAKLHGANVSHHPERIKEIGFHRIYPTEHSGSFLKEPMQIMQWHSEGFELPQGSKLLATNDEFENQAFSMGSRVVGMQFHPEVNPDVLRLWHERNKTRPTGVLTEVQRVEQMADAVRHDDEVTQWLNQFLHYWTDD